MHRHPHARRTPRGRAAIIADEAAIGIPAASARELADQLHVDVKVEPRNNLLI